MEQQIAIKLAQATINLADNGVQTHDTTLRLARALLEMHKELQSRSLPIYTVGEKTIFVEEARTNKNLYSDGSSERRSKKRGG